jgi:protein-S-isoprenylcysteine O-methyltransferase Ste14
VYGLKSAGYTAALWAVCLFGLPAALWRLQNVLDWNWARFVPGAGRWLAVLVFLGAAGVGFWSAAVLVRHGKGTPMPLECTRQLVIAGPYRFIRNPMATGGIAQGIAVGVFLGSWLVVAYALAGALVWHFVMRPWEERDMRQRFGPAFEEYRAAVPCWIPRLHAYAPKNPC